MSDYGLTKRTPEVNPERLVETLTDNGWSTVGYREGVYIRLRSNYQSTVSNVSVVIPLKRSASDFHTLMTAAIKSIRGLGEDVWIRAIEPLLMLTPVDRFRFRKETAAPQGLILWDDGVELVKSARQTLIAGAKFYMEPSRQFSNRFGQFAHRYINQVLMGQSGAGSYVVTALVPTEARVPIRGAAKETLERAKGSIALGREITSSTVRALEATAEAVDHFKSSGSMTGFEDNVVSGISYELVIALRDVVTGAEYSDIAIDLAQTGQMSLIEPTKERHHFEFSGADVSVLERASVQLSAPAKVEHLRITGRVHLLTRKDAGGPGVVGVDDGTYRYRVRFGSDEEYDEAIMAHYEDRHIRVEGALSREGTVQWLYNARLMSMPEKTPSDASHPVEGQRKLSFPE